jgi:hypothetical protein
MAVFSAVGIWCCRTPTKPRQSAALTAEYALFVLGMLLFSERTWKHHSVTLMLPFGVICYALAAGNIGRRTRTYLIGTLIAVQVALATTSTGWLPDDTWATLAQVYGAYTWAFLLLAAAMVAVLRNRAKAAAATVVPAQIQRAA